MKEKMKELQRIKGIGEILARRFVEAGYDTHGKIAEAGEEALKAIRGINPRAIASIISQAAGFAGEGGNGRAKRVEELKAAATTLKGQVEGIARSVRDRFTDEIQGKRGKKIEKELLKMVSALERVEGKIGKRVKRAGKGLAKAEARLAGLAEEGAKGVGKGLKKARKSLKRVLS
jgi:hypothetical protein